MLHKRTSHDQLAVDHFLVKRAQHETIPKRDSSNARLWKANNNDDDDNRIHGY